MNDVDATRIRPWAFVCVIAASVAVITAIVSLIAVPLMPVESPLPAGIAQAELVDGSVLVVRDVTYGKTHELSVTFRDDSWQV